jgi:hypothetical protein
MPSSRPHSTTGRLTFSSRSRSAANSVNSQFSANAFSGTRRVTISSMISVRISATVSDTSVAFMNSLRWA